MQNSSLRKILELELIKRDGYICQLCKKILAPEYGVEFHHKKPRKLGGEDALSNIVLVHRECHMQIHSGRKVMNQPNKRAMNTARSKYYKNINDEISEYINQGLSILAISKKMDISRPSIYDILKKFNKKTPLEIKRTGP